MNPSKVLIASLLLIGTLTCVDAECTSGRWTPKRCLHQNELPSYWSSKFISGNPCFDANFGTGKPEKRRCFISQNRVGSCECTQECGCIARKDIVTTTTPAPPTCDSRKYPKRFPQKCAAQGYGPDNRNTMCKFLTFGQGCGQVCERGMTADEKKWVLDKHNELRRKIALGLAPKQPSATDMEELEWDDELAESAQRWTDQCTSGHDHFHSTPKYKMVGQNYARFMYGQNNAENKALFDRFVQAWYDEVKDVNNDIVEHFHSLEPIGIKIGHYTALAWHKTKKVGCGFLHYNKSGPGYNYQKVLVCNYYPAGNIIGEEVYTQGLPAKDCPDGKSDDGLCLVR